MNLCYVFFSLAMAAESSQQLVYDLSIRGKLVGRRDVKITYIPASESKPLGSRRLESYTEIDHVVAGNPIKYRQRATAQISGKGSKKFVSSVSINDQVTEIQGRKLRDGSWSVYVVVPGTATEETYGRSQIDGFSLELFDPAQASKWQAEQSTKLLAIDGSIPEIWRGLWVNDGSADLRSTDKKMQGRQLSIKAKQGKLDMLWAQNGILLDWKVSLMGMTINADLREIPQDPKFGEIKNIKSFQGVQEEEL